MRHTRLRKLAGFALACLFVIGAQTLASAQGRGRGGGNPGAGNSGGGNPGRGGGNSGVGRPEGIGVDRGIGTSSDRSGGRSDAGRATASDRSNGRSDAGLERARLQRENSRRADDELRDHPRMAERLHMSANDLREGYRAALASDPDLRFGEYVAATRVAANLGARHPAVTREAILAGLARGDSLGETLRELRVNEREAKEARRQAERELKEAKRRSN